MNTKLIFTLSLFGLAMGAATISLIPSNIEPGFWLVIFLICAYLIAKQCSGKYFLHGFLVSVVNSIWITAAHRIFFDAYVANHQEEMLQMASMPMNVSARTAMLIVGPVIGILSGIVLGIFAFIASKLVKKKAA